jgi:hypothetical protein
MFRREIESDMVVSLCRSHENCDFTGITVRTLDRTQQTSSTVLMDLDEPAPH